MNPPLTIAATVTGRGGWEIIHTASGNAPAPVIEPTEMWRVQATITMNTTRVASSGSGVRQRYAPVKLATALPPLQPMNIGYACPAITAKAAADIHSALPSVRRPASQTARYPFAISRISVAAPVFHPVVRSTFVAPIFPLPD